MSECETVLDASLFNITKNPSAFFPRHTCILYNSRTDVFLTLVSLLVVILTDFELTGNVKYPPISVGNFRTMSVTLGTICG